MISFLFYNYGVSLEKSKKELESQSAYKRGLILSMSVLGEYDFLTVRFKNKVTFSPKDMDLFNFNYLDEGTPNRLTTKDSKSSISSDHSHPSSNTGTQTQTQNGTLIPRQRHISQEKEIKSFLKINNNNNNHKRRNSVSIVQELKKKVDKIYSKMDSLGSKLEDNSHQNNHLKQNLIIQPSTQFSIRDKDRSPRRRSTVNHKNKIAPIEIIKEADEQNNNSLEKLKMTFKPKIMKIIFDSEENVKSQPEAIIEKDNESSNDKIEKQDKILRKIINEENLKEFYKTEPNKYINSEIKLNTGTFRNPTSNMNNSTISNNKIDFSYITTQNDRSYTLTQNDKQDLSINSENEMNNSNISNITQVQINKKSSNNKKSLKGIFSMAINNDGKKAKPRKSFLDAMLNRNNLSMDFNSSTVFNDKFLNKKSVNIYDTRMSRLEDSQTDLNLINIQNEMKKFVPINNYQSKNKNDNYSKLIKKLSKNTSEIGNLNNIISKVSSESIDSTFKSDHDKIVSKKKTQGLFKHLIENNVMKDPKDDLFENIIDYKFIDDENNYFLTKIKREINFSEYFDKLVEENKDWDNSWCIYRLKNEEIFKICLFYSKNHKGITLKLLNLNGIIICEENISFDKISILLSKMNIDNILSKNSCMQFNSNLKMFMENIFIYFCHCLKKDDINKCASLGVMSKPVGIFTDQIYEFEFLKTICYLDFVITGENLFTMFIFNMSTESIFLRFEMIFDDGSFKSLFKELNSYHEKSESNPIKLIKSYMFASETHIKKKGFINQLLVKIQEIFKIKNNNNDITFNTLGLKYEKSLFKIFVQQKLSDSSLWMINYEGNYKWAIDYFTLKKVESNYISKLII